MARFGRVVTAMVTPFNNDGSLNLDGARRLAKWLQDNGNDGLVVAGTTGESPVLTDDERLSLFAAVTEAVTIPVIAGTGTNDTAHSVHMTKEATKLGVAGILAVTPYYNRPPQSGIEAHMRAMAAATNLPVVVYDIPTRTGRKIATSLILKLANEVSNIVALKDAAGNPAESAVLMSQAPAGFELYSGDDGLTLPFMAIGGSGVIGVATHWTGQDHQEMFALWEKGDVNGARRVNARMLESFAFETGDDNPNPLPSKVMMNVLGLQVGEARLPMGPPPAGLEERAKKVLENLRAARAASN
ncbi:MAG: 4-hydroxy-tetrahydrodipicolinate synthase [Actinobacteria bacterium]|uniref:4-hydroxy-tetrahydrodipicolinate synthase n=1 Tax=freshwater metagenome TaxID=449393 RepID=A0A6J7MSB9_9ZZZZ|nr:4-hydroxy-tetrahydrodipicolinate synthase [Actinomycetota bacterium]